MRILVDYRPALRERTGVGEYIHQLAGAYSAATDDEVVLFSSSWKDRLSPTVAAELGVKTVDRRAPVALLNYLWHRLQWPPVEMLAGRADVVHAAHPLLIPARHAAQVVTIHDLFFLAHPERTRAEIRRDYPALTAIHARRADAVITSTEYGRRLITEQLGVGAERVYVCPAGAPAWQSLGRQPHMAPDGYILFLGTLEPRKNIGALLDAYSLLLDRLGPPKEGPTTRLRFQDIHGSFGEASPKRVEDARRREVGHYVQPAPRLVLAGRATPEADEWLARITRPPLAGHVAYLGYVPTEERERVYAGARVVVIPSLDEGFGLPALEAMSAGIPVVASNRGSLPEVLGDAGILVEPSDVHGLAHALERVLTDDEWAAARATAGLARAGMFTWVRAAATLRRAYTEAVARRRARSRLGIGDW